MLIHLHYLVYTGGYRPTDDSAEYDMWSWPVKGAIQVLRNTDGGGGGCQIFPKKALRRCKVQRYYCYEGIGGGQIFRKKRYVTLKWPQNAQPYIAHELFYMPWV